MGSEMCIRDRGFGLGLLQALDASLWLQRPFATGFRLLGVFLVRGPVPAGVLAGLLVGDSLVGALLAVAPVFAIVALAPVLLQLGQPVPACAHIFHAFLYSVVLSGNWLLPQVRLEAAGGELAPE